MFCGIFHWAWLTLNDSPEVLELTAADELVASENIEVLRQNGFELDIDEDRPPGQRVRMTAHPVSGSTKFDAKGRLI